jgi:polyisoprenoid-binding protein YceI
MNHRILRRGRALGALLTLSLIATQGLLATDSHAAGLTGKTGSATAAFDGKVRANALKFVSDAPAEKIEGVAPGSTGRVTFDLANLEKTSGTLSVPVAKMKTGNDMRDDHMRGPEWLDAAKHPEITVKIEKLEGIRVADKKGAKQSLTATAVGTITIHGKAAPLKAKVDITWMDSNPKRAKKAKGDWVKVSTKFSVALANHGVKGKAGVVGSKVGKTIEIEGIFYGHTG